MKEDQSSARKHCIYWNGACGIGDDLPGACGALMREIVDRVARQAGLPPENIDSGYRDADGVLADFTARHGHQSLGHAAGREILFGEFGIAIMERATRMTLTRNEVGESSKRQAV